MNPGYLKKGRQKQTYISVIDGVTMCQLGSYSNVMNK